MHREAGFTLMELMFAAALFSAFAVVSILAFTQMNRYASNARYESLALSVVRQKMDQIMTSPCYINTGTNSSLGPILYLSGTTVSPSGAGSGTYAPIITGSSVGSGTLPLNNDKYNLTRTINSGSALTITLNGTNVAGSDDTQVLDGMKISFSSISTNPREMTVTVSGSYNYRGEEQVITFSSLRATDNF